MGHDEAAFFDLDLEIFPRVDIMGVFLAETKGFLIDGLLDLFEENLDRIDWALLQNKDFKGDPDDPGKKERYQAEALVYKHLPLDGLDGVICCSTSVEEKIKLQICERGSTLKTGVQPQWFF